MNLIEHIFIRFTKSMMRTLNNIRIKVNTLYNDTFCNYTFKKIMIDKELSTEIIGNSKMQQQLQRSVKPIDINSL